MRDERDNRRSITTLHERREGKMRGILTIVLVVVTTLAVTSCAMTPAPLLPENLTWTAPPTLPSGAKLAVLAGNPSQPGLSTYRLRFPANYQVPAHFHPVAENVTVISGTVYLGMGDKLDMSKGTAYPAGSFATVQGNMHHYAWTKEEAVVQVHLVGPTGITYVNPADDPRKK